MIDEKTKQKERAMVQKTTRKRQRATPSEKTKMNERANTLEKTMLEERAKRSEKTTEGERAMGREKTMGEERIKQAARSIRAAIRKAIESAVYEVRRWRIAYLRSHAYEGRRVNEYVSAQLKWWETYER